MRVRRVRGGVFETNSSSTHSVCIGRKAPEIKINLVNENGEVVLKCGEYGWEYEQYTNILDRLSYATTYAIMADNDFRAYCRYDLPLNRGPHMEMLEKTIKQYVGDCTITYFYDDSYFYPFGYIDHQSLDEVSDIFESEDSLAHFLFSPDSYFITDNDNH